MNVDKKLHAQTLFNNWAVLSYRVRALSSMLQNDEGYTPTAAEHLEWREQAEGVVKSMEVLLDATDAAIKERYEHPNR
jgi:hypothetical protein